jgi:hypothetical protein
VSVDSILTTVVVDLDAAEAFEVFTTEMPQWYRRGAASLGGPEKETALRLEPHVGGRVLRVDPDGTETATGQVTAWQPGARLGFVDQRGTEVEVWFEPDGSSTRVVLEHRKLGMLPDDVAAALAQYGWRRLPLWFEDYVKERKT